MSIWGRPTVVKWSRGNSRILQTARAKPIRRCASFFTGAQSESYIIRKPFFYKHLQIELESNPQPKPHSSELMFGKYFSDHMFKVDWSLESCWGVPRICPTRNLDLHPAAKILHYGQGLFEGMKAYRGPDGEVRLFRPELNIARMLGSAARLSLPSFDPDELRKCLLRLIDVDRNWVPDAPSTSLYIRPTFIGTEPTLGLAESAEALLYVITSPVGLYYDHDSLKPVSLLADPSFVRAWPGGTGDKKLGCNYSPTLAIQKKAVALGLQQVLWLFGPDQQITEVGAMNVFIFQRGLDGELELVTPPLNGLILPGITRRSVLELAREWEAFRVVERDITMVSLRQAIREGRVLEMFGTGTAATVTPIDRIFHRRGDSHEELVIPTMKSEAQLFKKILRRLTSIQYGLVEHPWSVRVERSGR